MKGGKKEKMRVGKKEGNTAGLKQRKREIEPVIEVRRSQRKRNQRMVIQPDQISDCDDTKDIDYR